MSTQITINPDNTLSVKWIGKRGHGSLFQIAAESNAALVNKLERDEIAAVAFAVRHCPFPCGQGKKVYEMILSEIRTMGVDTVLEPGTDLGKLRKYAVLQAKDGCNAPWDSYLRTAVECKS